MKIRRGDLVVESVYELGAPGAGRPVVSDRVVGEIAATEAFIERLNARALAMDGTCTGEHGIGQGKQEFLVAELGGSVDIMRQIKRSLDPMNILNPGKIFALD